MFNPFVEENDAIQIFSRTPYFTLAEFAAQYVAAGHRPSSVRSVLRYYCARGRIIPVRRGLYASCEAGDADPFVLAAKLVPDPIIAYEGALAFHRLCELEHSLTVVAKRKTPPLVSDEIVYRVAPHPLPRGEEHLYTSTHSIRDTTLRVTSPARTFVDCLDRLHLGPGFTETLEAFASNPELRVDFDEVEAYTRKLGHRVTAARVGACLWGHPAWCSISVDHQFRLARFARQTMYAVPQPIEEPSYLGRFRLIVPGAFMTAVHQHRQ